MTNVRLVDTAETKTLVDAPPDGLVFLDVRAPEEFNAGRLPGAIMINIYDDTFADQVLALDRSVPYLVYCKAGSRSRAAAEFMATNGFTDVADYGGGWLQWSASDGPVES